MCLEINGRPKKILKYPNSRLRVPSEKCEFSENLIKLIANMKETMMKNGGVGLAAIQIGVPRQVFIAYDNIFINPELIIEDETQIYSVEGCLSLPNNLQRKVKRFQKISVRYTTERGEQELKEFDGQEACVIQHEFDHLKGVLIIDKDNQ